MSNTMEQFKEVVGEIKQLEDKVQNIKRRFENSTCELSECFHWIIKAELEGSKHTSLTIFTCPELYAKELETMGFVCKEQRNVFNTLCGYDISW